MRIAVVGSWHENETEFPARRSFDEFKTACQQLGASIASAGHSLALGSETESTADRHVFDGYARSAQLNPAHAATVLVIHPNDGRQKPFQTVAHNNSWVRYSVPKFSDWRSTHLHFVKEADAILVIGGRKSTYLAGWAAIAGAKVVIPIGAFGGAAEKLLADMQTIEPPARYQELLTLNNWTNDSCKRVLETLSMVQKGMVSQLDPATLRIRDLLQQLTVAQFWSLICATLGAISAVAALAFWLGTMVPQKP